MTDQILPYTEATGTGLEPEVDPNEGWPTYRNEAERAYAVILQALLAGDLDPTEEHPSSEIAASEQFGFTSRMPVRMGLAMLASEGLIEQRARHGFWRLCRQREEIIQIAALRADAEAMVLSAVASRLHDGVLHAPERYRTHPQDPQAWQVAHRARQTMEQLAEQVGHSDEHVPTDVEASFATADTRFHTNVAAATGYDLPGDHLRRWRNLLRLYRHCNGIRYTGADLWRVHSEHEGLMERVETAAQRCDEASDEALEAAAAWHVAHSVERAGIQLGSSLRTIVGGMSDPFETAALSAAQPTMAQVGVATASR